MKSSSPDTPSIRHPSSLVLPGLFLLAGLLLASAGQAQPSQPAPPQFGELIEVRSVNVEVVVEDKKGNRVTDLEAEDFQLLVDGEPYPLDFFSRVQDGRLQENPRHSPETVPAPDAGMDAGEPMGTSYLVFIDEFFTRKVERNRAIEGIRDHVSRLGPADRMAVVAFTGRRLEMLSNWTTSPADLQKVFDEAKQRKAFGQITAVRLRGSQAEAVEHQLGRQLQSITKAVTSTLRSFAQPPGRKVMLLAAGTWPFSPQRYAYDEDFLYDRFDRGGAQWSEVSRTANLLGYTLYPIDAAGISAGNFDMGDARPRRRQGFSQSTVKEDEVHLTLRTLAAETGGLALIDGGRVKALDTVVSDTRTYYWLGFTPDWLGNDENHEIKIGVSRPGLKLRYRQGYEDLSASKEVSFMTESALLFDQMPDLPPLQVEFGEAKGGWPRASQVPLRVTFPMDAITMLPHEGGYGAVLELRIAALDENGNRSDLDVLPVRLQGPEPPEPGDRGMQEVALELRRRPQEVIVSLYDPMSGNVLMSKVDYEP